MTAPTPVRERPAIDLFVHTAPATAVELAGAAIIDVAVLGLLAGLVTTAALLGGAAFGVSAAIVAAVVVGALLHRFARVGRTPGALVHGLRVVSAATAAAPGRSLARLGVTGRLRALSIRRGRDPLSAPFAPFRFPEQALRAARDVRPTTPSGTPCVLSLDSGQQLALSDALVIGRGPIPRRADGVQGYEWADLSRTVSREHALFEWDGRSAWLTDLGSTNGTAVAVDGTYRPIPPRERIALPRSVAIALGDRKIRVEVPHE